MTSRKTNESTRLEELRRLRILDSGEEKAYNDIVRMASQLLGAPISLISLIDEDRQWFKARKGMDAPQTPRSMAFCSHTIEDPGRVLVVNDALLDERFKDNPLVTGSPNIRFYAGAPLVTPSGAAIGSLCVIDSKPRDIDPRQLEELQRLAAKVTDMMRERAEFLGLFKQEEEPGSN